MWSSLLLFALVRAAGDEEAARKSCPPKCNCMKYLGKIFMNHFRTTCVSCKDEFKLKWFGQGCDTPCQEWYYEDEKGVKVSQADNIKVGRGNCQGCTFEGTCEACKDGFWDPKPEKGQQSFCDGVCPENCRGPSSDPKLDGKMVHACLMEKGSCQACKLGTCNLGQNCRSTCPEHCLNYESCNVATCGCDTCEMGWWGRACEKECNDKPLGGCQHCDKETGRCLGCMPTFYALSQGCLECPVNCRNQACDDDGKCSQGCADNKFYGDKCEHECPAGCDERGCKQNGKCSCREGQFGDDCSQSCPSGCDPNGNPLCNAVNGECDCAPGQWGQLCTQGNICTGECNYKCSKNCVNGQCDKATGACECKRGFWGTNCENRCNEHCLTGKCDKATGTCVECQSGYYGAKCELTCDRHCRNGQCAQADGSCKCEQGRYGEREESNPQCEQKCPHCDTNVGLNHHRQPRSVCKKADGRCYKCPEGKWGKQCENACAANCVPNTCDRDSGVCTCKTGFWGSNCQACPADCANHCDQQTGACTGGCEPGKWGKPSCDKKCPDHCVEDACDEETGQCSAGCERGWWGDNCDKTCPEGTADFVGCAQDDGTSDRCKQTFWGHHCDKPCPRHCGDGSCDQYGDPDFPLGKCHSCEEQMYYNPDCETLCPDGCKHGKCDMTGRCTSCNNGLFGEKCDKRCPANCNGKGCDQDSGICDECIVGYWDKDGKCGGTCHKRCLTCMGDGKQHCLSCDNAAELCEEGGTTNWGPNRGEHVCTRPKTNKPGKCKCLTGSTRYTKSTPEVVLGAVLKKSEQCYCDALGDDKGVPWWPQAYGSTKICHPQCPPQMGSYGGDKGLRCYPSEVIHILRSTTPSQGRCPDGHLEINFSPEICIVVQGAMIVYEFDKHVQPAPASSRKPLPKELCQKDGQDAVNEDGDKLAKITSLCLPESYRQNMIGGNAVLTI